MPTFSDVNPPPPPLSPSCCPAPRWTRREECDFYRVVSTFGVEKAVKREQPGQLLLPPAEDPQPEYDWSRFRTFARLDKKTDESLSRYFRVFVAMCRRVCHLRPARGEGRLPGWGLPPWGCYRDGGYQVSGGSWVSARGFM